MRDAERDELYAYVDGKIRAVDERVASYGKAAEQVGADVRRLLAVEDERPPVIHWPDLEPDEAEEAWDALCHWIDTVLVRYPEARWHLRPCWEQHPNVVDSLTALWLTWVAIYRNPKASPVEAAAWHRDWLPAFLAQLKAAMRRCLTVHEEPDQTGRRPPASQRTHDSVTPTIPR